MHGSVYQGLVWYSWLSYLWFSSLTFQTTTRNGDDLLETWQFDLALYFGKSTLTVSSILSETYCCESLCTLCQHLESGLPWDGPVQGCFLVWLTEVPAKLSHSHTRQCVCDRFHLKKKKKVTGFKWEQRGKDKHKAKEKEKRHWVWEKKWQRPKETLPIQYLNHGMGQGAVCKAGQLETSPSTMISQAVITRWVRECSHSCKLLRFLPLYPLLNFTPSTQQEMNP